MRKSIASSRQTGDQGFCRSCRNVPEMAVEPSATPVLLPVPGEVPPRARAFAALVVLIGLAAGGSVAAWVVVGAPLAIGSGVGTLLLLGALLALSETMQLSVYDEGQTSPGSVPVLAAGVLCGPLAVPLLEVTVTLVGDIARRQLRLATCYERLRVHALRSGRRRRPRRDRRGRPRRLRPAAPAARWPASPTSRSTPGSSPSRRRSTPASRCARASTSTWPGSPRTTSAYGVLAAALVLAHAGARARSACSSSPCRRWPCCSRWANTCAARRRWSRSSRSPTARWSTCWPRTGACSPPSAASTSRRSAAWRTPSTPRIPTRRATPSASPCTAPASRRRSACRTSSAATSSTARCCTTSARSASPTRC